MEMMRKGVLTLFKSCPFYSCIRLAGCTSPHVQTSSGTCVNIMIDFNNCGAIGYVCPANYTSCEVGICSTAPSIQLPNAVSATGSATSIGNVDDAMFNVNLPFNITLYTTTTDLITVTSNGVSICFD